MSRCEVTEAGLPGPLLQEIQTESSEMSGMWCPFQLLGGDETQHSNSSLLKSFSEIAILNPFLLSTYMKGLSVD